MSVSFTLATREARGQSLRDRRLAAGLTQAALCETVNRCFEPTLSMTQMDISRVERGRRELHALEALAVARALTCSVEELLSVAEPQPTHYTVEVVAPNGSRSTLRVDARDLVLEAVPVLNYRSAPDQSFDVEKDLRDFDGEDQA